MNMEIDFYEYYIQHFDKLQWEIFNQLLDASPTDNDKLSHLLNHKAPWE